MGSLTVDRMTVGDAMHTASSRATSTRRSAQSRA